MNTSHSGDPFARAYSTANTISIVGVGPKGLQCFERLLAELAHRPAVNRRVYIHLFNSTGYLGASRVYHPSLPPYLAVNNSNPEEITATAASELRPCVTSIPTFIDWRSRAEDDESITPISRASVGRYLNECGRALVAAAPAGVVVQVHAAEVFDIDTDASELLIRARRPDGSEMLLASGQVLLATGHGLRDGSMPTLNNKMQYFQGVVAIRGLGLAALDLIFELTEGRGGRFQETIDGRLEYRRSGNEPARMVPCCRTGVPILPQHVRQEAQDRRLMAFTLGHLESARLHRFSGLSWHGDLWPLAMSEFRHQFETALRRFASLATTTACERDRSFRTDFLFAPGLLPDSANDFEYATRVIECIESLLAPVETDVVLHAYRSAVSSWYEISEVLGYLCRHELLDPDSHVQLIRNVLPTMRRTAYGANANSMRKLLALVDAGLVDLSMLRADVIKNRTGSAGWLIRSRRGRIAPADELATAFFTPFDIRTDASDLFRALLNRGVIRPHVLKGAVSSDGATGAIDVTAKEQWVITRHGRIDDRISIVGIPIDGRVLNTWTISPDTFPAEWASRVCDRVARVAERVFNVVER